MQEWKHTPAQDHGLSSSDRHRSLKRESGLISTGMHFAWWTMVRSYMLVWHGLTIHGKEHIPAAPPYILIANHSSHLDALVLAAPLPWRQRDRIFPIAAGDVFFHTPLASAFAANLLNALPMWRKSCGPHALAQLRQRMLEEPCAYILFPEGTRSRDGQMNPFKPGLGMLVAETKVPVVPCYLEGCFEALTAEQKFPSPKRIRMHIGAPLTFEEIGNNREGWTHIATTTEERVKNLAPRLL